MAAETMGAGAVHAPRNAWYAAAWDYELGGTGMLAREIAAEAVVLYRRRDGRVAALEDACWHRQLPLSAGRREGDDLVCGYHGLAFNAEGRCVHMPSQETINPAACVRAFPCVERHRMAWVWPGDPALADEALIPDVHWNDAPGWIGEGGMAEVKAEYRLILDNLMDLTHETFVHSTSIGNRAVAEAPFQVTHSETGVRVARWMLGIEAPPLWARRLGKPGPVDRWQIIDFKAPSTIVLDAGVAPAGTGAPEGDRSQGVNRMSLHIITPATERSSYYFWNSVRNYQLDQRRLTEEDRNAIRAVFREDQEILEQQQRAIDRRPGRPFNNLNIDAGALWARRLIDAAVAAERGAPRLAAAGRR